jgi:hypothetical protein
VTRDDIALVARLRSHAGGVSIEQPYLVLTRRESAALSMMLLPGYRPPAEAWAHASAGVDAPSVLRATALAWGLSENALLGPGRRRRLVWARYAAILVLRDDLGSTYAAIGQLLERHHSTAIAGYRRACEILNSDDGASRDFASRVAHVRASTGLARERMGCSGSE